MKKDLGVLMAVYPIPVTYDISELDELVLAYATTIHKSQGSEYPVVVMPVLMSHYIMLQRNLIYTGITRAKKILVLVGTRKALSYAIRNLTVQKRNTLLKDRIRAVCQGNQANIDTSTNINGKAITGKVIQGSFTNNLEEGPDNTSGRLAMVAEKPVHYGKKKKD